jgi:hypothetical protein
MPAVVQTKSRANRIKLFKKYVQATPTLRCYHGSRLPPRSFEGFWPHKKFYKIYRGKPKRLAKGEPLLKKKLTAKPAKRKKRGALKVKRPPKKKVVVKQIKPKKKVTFKKTYGVRRAQEEKVYRGRAHLGEAEYVAPGDPVKVRWTRGEAGRAQRVVAPARRRIRLV